MKRWALTLIVTVSCLVLSAQIVHFDGYVSGLYSPMIPLNSGKTLHNGLLHNRLNLKITPNTHWTLSLEVRNRALFGDYRLFSPQLFDVYTQDNGWMNLSWNWTESNYMIGNSAIERLYVGYERERFAVRIGRQRINWSQTMVFNPNDLFNGYSYFDFDYIERSGSDAVRLSYFPSETSAVEVAAKVNRWHEVTAAGFYRVNVNGWDVQAVGGVLNSVDIIVGGGFSGDLNGLNLRGEASYFYNYSDDTKLKHTVVASIGSDYVFGNSLIISGELLYNRQADGEINNILSIYTSTMSPKQLSLSEWTAVAQVSYPFSPILSGSFAVMSYIDLPVFFFGPSFDWSVTENFSISTMCQLFLGGQSLSSSNILVGYLRLKYNF